MCPIFLRQHSKLGHTTFLTRVPLALVPSWGDCLLPLLSFLYLRSTGRGFSCGLMNTTLNYYMICLVSLQSSSSTHCCCLWWTLRHPQIPSPSQSNVAPIGPNWWLLRSCCLRSFSTKPSVQVWGAEVQVPSMIDWDPWRVSRQRRSPLPTIFKLHHG